MNNPLAPSSQLAAESKFQWLTRAGFAARGLLYIVIAFLVIGTGRTEDLTGALEYVGQGSGKILLIGIAAGLAVYGLWRLSDLIFATEHPGDGAKTLGKRAVAGFIGAIYLYLSYKAVRVLAGESAGEGTAATQQQADTVLDLPGGELFLFIVAAILAIAGAAQLWKTLHCSFMARLQEGAAGQEWIKWMGRAGYAARGIIFLILAWQVVRAASSHDSGEVGNIERALDLLRGPFLIPIAAGLLLFGLFSLVEARFRRIHRPPVERVADAMPAS